MLNVPRWRVVAVILVTALGALFALPNILPSTVRQNIPVLQGFSSLNLGLDLRGGSHLLLEVDANALVAQELENVVDEMATALREAQPRIAQSGRGVANDVARLRVNDPEMLQRALQAITRDVNTDIQAGNLGQTAKRLDITSSPDGVIQARLTEEMREQMIRRSVNQSIEVLRRRIDPTGTSEVSIGRQGLDRIVVQAPGEQDPESLKRRIGTTAQMTFHLVNPSVGFEDASAGRAPPGTILVPQDSRPDEPFVAVYSRAILSGEDLTRATVGFDQQNGAAVVNLQFDARGARIFGRTTAENVDRRFAIVLDGNVLTAPNINEPIPGGRAQISGSFTVESAQELVDLLNAGALPAPLSILEERSVGPGLGQDAINAGSYAGILAGLGVLAFMLVTYGFVFGGIACLALVVNLILIIGAMSSIGAALTLPGIAGLILTAAMAVDANVLIYERMREEAALGKGPALALDAGFNRAIVAILDANFTTILAALILFQFGAGPVRGFAWTLSIGVITSVFTAVLITQILIAWWFRAARPKKLPI
jgi:protein-export membrane protein SecD